MKKHADILRPKFDIVLKTLDKELGGLGIGSWLAPRGGYFISFDSMDGCAKAIVAKAKEAGLIMTGAGATFPYGKDYCKANKNKLKSPSKTQQGHDHYRSCPIFISLYTFITSYLYRTD